MINFTETRIKRFAPDKVYLEDKSIRLPADIDFGVRVLQALKHPEAILNSKLKKDTFNRFAKLQAFLMRDEGVDNQLYVGCKGTVSDALLVLTDKPTFNPTLEVFTLANSWLDEKAIEPYEVLRYQMLQSIVDLELSDRAVFFTFNDYLFMSCGKSAVLSTAKIGIDSEVPIYYRSEEDDCTELLDAFRTVFNDFTEVVKA